MDVPLPLGDVVDKLTILRIKARKMRDPSRRANVERELRALQQRWDAAGHGEPAEQAELERVNGALWDVEDQLRRFEAASDFGPEFVELARSVYRLNDQRAALKRSINDALGSELVEEKEYVEYR